MTPTFIGYDQAERMVSALIGGVAEWRPDCVAGIARGGLVPATMVACALALPLSVISFERRSRAVAWVGAAPPPGRVVLVDDCCATGETLGAVRNALVAEGFPCLTLTIVHDPETTAFVPDFSHPMRTLFRLPWERGESTPAARALRATGAPADRRTELPFIGLALDGVFLPDRSRAEYAADIAEALRRRDALQPFARLPAFPPDRAVIITGRSEISRPQTEAWLRRWGFGDLPLACRPADVGHDAATMARHKAEVATRWGCTHFIEGDPEQAMRIAAIAPHLLVSWWSCHEGRAWTIGAAAQPTRAP